MTQMEQMTADGLYSVFARMVILHSMRELKFHYLKKLKNS